MSDERFQDWQDVHCDVECADWRDRALAAEGELESNRLITSKATELLVLISRAAHRIERAYQEDRLVGSECPSCKENTVHWNQFNEAVQCHHCGHVILSMEDRKKVRRWEDAARGLRFKVRQHSIGHVTCGTYLGDRCMYMTYDSEDAEYYADKWTGIIRAYFAPLLNETVSDDNNSTGAEEAQ